MDPGPVITAGARQLVHRSKLRGRAIYSRPRPDCRLIHSAKRRNFSQESLAEMIGTTRFRVSFFMNKFRKLGFIEYNGGLTVHSSLLNVVLHH